MKTLTLLRHAKSSWDDAVARDFDRPLNSKGERAAQTMGRKLRAIGTGFDLVVASPAARVQQTLAQVAIGYGAALAPEWDRRIYLASTATLLEVIHELPASADHVLLAGHNPGLEELVLLLSAGSGDNRLRDQVEIKFPTGSIAELAFEGAWAEVVPGSGALNRFVRPRDLDASLGPDAE